MLKYLNNKLVIVEKKEITKVELLEKLVNVIYDNTELVESKEEFFRKIMERESIGTTGIGKGIAIPHARCEKLKNIVCAFAILKKGVEFNTPDEEKVKILVMVGAPKDKNSEYLAILSSITKAFRDKTLRDTVMEANTEAAVLETIAAFFEGK